MRKLPTISDVAARACVGRSTVSRFLNQGYLKAGTRARIEEAIAELGYAPSWTARSLSLGRRGTIGVVIKSSLDPWTVVFLAGILDEVEGHDASLVRATLGPREPGDWSKVLAWIRNDRTDGLILADLCADPAVAAAATDRTLPIVAVIKSGLTDIGPSRSVGRAACRRLFEIARQNAPRAKRPRTGRSSALRSSIAPLLQSTQIGKPPP
jgi:LacI family transcriptional regulator